MESFCCGALDLADDELVCAGDVLCMWLVSWFCKRMRRDDLRDRFCCGTRSRLRSFWGLFGLGRRVLLLLWMVGCRGGLGLF